MPVPAVSHNVRTVVLAVTHNKQHILLDYGPNLVQFSLYMLHTALIIILPEAQGLGPASEGFELGETSGQALPKLHVLQGTRIYISVYTKWSLITISRERVPTIRVVIAKEGGEGGTMMKMMMKIMMRKRDGGGSGKRCGVGVSWV
ncbi:hypothetical protein EDD16DRAFT_1732326 [Pisolithus croceorrhizus]|nr:hypothetical protein EDD16DRAFT_1732326 [Pisolithus croceorrhizus]